MTRSKAFLKSVKTMWSGDLNSASCSTMIRWEAMWSVHEGSKWNSNLFSVVKVFGVFLQGFRDYSSSYLRNNWNDVNTHSIVALRKGVILRSLDDHLLLSLNGKENLASRYRETEAWRNTAWYSNLPYHPQVVHLHQILYESWRCSRFFSCSSSSMRSL